MNPQKHVSETSQDQSKWTFFTNHAHVMILLTQDPDLTLREVAERIGITERAVQRIIHDLEEGQYLTKERVGRRNHYFIDTHTHLRHHIEAHCEIGEILQAVLKNQS